MGTFLPKDFDPKRSILAIVAGRGLYPLLLAERALAAGVRCRLIGLEGEVSETLWDLFPEAGRRKVAIGQLGKFLKILKQFGATDVILAGQIRPLRLFRDLRPDLRALFLLRRLKERNAATIFSTLCDQIAERGMRVLDARSFMEEDLVKRSEHYPIDRQQLEYGIYVASEIARLNIGQSVVIKRGTVLCVEGFDGTDAMLRHVKEMNTRGSFFIKTSKMEHDFRFDVPVFGETTLKLLAEAGIRYVALESDRTLILNQGKVLKEADELGIKVFGY